MGSFALGSFLFLLGSCCIGLAVIAIIGCAFLIRILYEETNKKIKEYNEELRKRRY